MRAFNGSDAELDVIVTYGLVEVKEGAEVEEFWLEDRYTPYGARAIHGSRAEST